MRHNNKKAKLGMTSSHRKAMFRNMLSSLFEHGAITTTDAKAKELKRRADILISAARRDGGLHRRRLAAGELFGAFAVQRLFDHWAKAFPNRSSGFTRTVKIGQRQGDGAHLTLVEMINDSADAPKAAEAAEK